MKNNDLSPKSALQFSLKHIKPLLIILAFFLCFSSCKKDEETEPAAEENNSQTVNFSIEAADNAGTVLGQAAESIAAGNNVSVTSLCDTWIMDSIDFVNVYKIITDEGSLLQSPTNIQPKVANVAALRVAYNGLNKPTIKLTDANAKYFRMSRFCKDSVNYDANAKIASDTLALGQNDEIAGINDLHKETKNLVSNTPSKVYQTTLDELNTKFGEDKIPNIGMKTSFGVVENHDKVQEITEAMKSNKLRYNNGFNPMAKCLNMDALEKTDVTANAGNVWLSNFEQIMKFTNEQGGNVLRGRGALSSTTGIPTLYYYDWTINASTTPLYLSDLIAISTKFDYDTLMTYSSSQPDNYMEFMRDENNNKYNIIYDIPDVVPDNSAYNGRLDTVSYVANNFKINIGNHNVINMAKKSRSR